MFYAIFAQASQPGATAVDWGQAGIALVEIIIGLAAVIATVRHILGEVQRKLGEMHTELKVNTKTTEETKTAAEAVQTATFDRLDYDRLRRMEAALLTLDACEPCRDAIFALTDRRRLRPQAPEEPPK